ncbi:MAG: Nucleotidyl transferase [Microgenomates bacterium 39_7]|nr:MAG: Nucleotidyl transferase [Microgenomates bacterium 39_7]
MKGIILAGGRGTRLQPLTRVTSKQLLPIYDQPMIFYPLQTLLQAGITEIMIIIAPDHAGDFLKLLGSGKEFGCDFTYEIQEKAEGLAQAFLIGESFIGKDNVTLVLGDNLFEDDFTQAIQSFESGGRVFAKKVSDPERFGVVEFDYENKAISIEEKPAEPKSEYAVTGLYIYDSSVVQKAKSLSPSARGELEITDLNNLYLAEKTLDVAFVEGKWFDTGTFESMYEATTFAREKKLAKK